MSSQPKSKTLSFDNTEIVFRGKTNADIERAYWLFKIMSNNFLTKIGPPITNFSMKIGLPIKSLIKATIFRHFCGGETIEECEKTVKQLDMGGVGSILDYSIEGEDDEKVFDETCEEIMRTIIRADGDNRIPFAVFKPTGLGRFALLEKMDAGETLNEEEKAEFQRMQSRVNQICELAHRMGITVMIDAEKSWIQNTIDALVMDMMRRYNTDKPIVYNTYQLYRKDKLASLITDIQQAESGHFMLGAKLVRGAYMEIERQRALDNNYPSPIHENKAATDRDYDEAMRFCISRIGSTAFLAGTHNQESCRVLAELLDQKQVAHDHKHVYFSQLLGMSDNLSFNLAAAGYNVAKYVPYGPIEAVMPYLFRRAEENTSVAGQMGRELSLIAKEKKRRRLTTQE